MPRSHSEYEFNDNMKRLTLDVSDITYQIKSESVYCIVVFCATSEKNDNDPISKILGKGIVKA